MWLPVRIAAKYFHPSEKTIAFSYGHAGLPIQCCYAVKVSLLAYKCPESPIDIPFSNHQNATTTRGSAKLDSQDSRVSAYRRSVNSCKSKGCMGASSIRRRYRALTSTSG